MRDKRRVSYSVAEMAAVHYGLKQRIRQCLARVADSKTDDALRFWATECASAIGAYRKSWVFPSWRDDVFMRANAYVQELARTVHNRRNTDAD